MIACCAATIGVVICGTWVLVQLVASKADPARDDFLGEGYIRRYADQVGFTVIGAWLAMVLIGSWRPLPCWIDRLGRTLGLLWIGMILVNLLSYAILPIVELWVNAST